MGRDFREGDRAPTSRRADSTDFTIDDYAVARRPHPREGWGGE